MQIERIRPNEYDVEEVLDKVREDMISLSLEDILLYEELKRNNNVITIRIDLTNN